jgi:hypothetical protein
MDFLKLQSLTLAYQLSADQIGRFGLGSLGMRNVTIGLTGRDLLNVHNCTCANVEQTRSYEDNAEGEGNARYWTSSRAYPASATLTGEISITF